MHDVLVPGAAEPARQLRAISHYSGFADAHDTYNALSAASDGRMYYVLSSDIIDKGGQLYAYDPATDQSHFIADLTEACGESGMKAVGQGKSHVEFFEYQGRLYFATHVGFYEFIDDIERLPQHVPEGYSLYPGGHFLSYDLSTGSFEDLATVSGGEGILTLTMDTQRGQLYGITWPYGNFVHYDLAGGVLKELGPVSEKGEGGKLGADYRVLCRSLVVDPNDGDVYGSTADGNIFRYRSGDEKLVTLEDVSLRLDYFGQYDHTRAGSMGYNWRKIFWYAPENVAYGVHGNSGYLFRFDPRRQVVEIVERITSAPSKRSGMFDLFTYGYLGFQLGPDQQTIYYLTGGPVYADGKRLGGSDDILVGVKGVENLHLVTFHIPSSKYIDHGPVFYDDGERPTYVNSIAIGSDGTVYTLARFKQGGKVIQDLVKIPVG